MSEPFNGDVSRTRGWVQMLPCYVTSRGTASKGEAVLAYWESEPYQVTLSFPQIQVRWRFSRDLLSDGILLPSGEGDVHVRPTPCGLEVTLSVSFTASVLFDYDEVVEFLAHTVDLVAPGYEHIDVPDDVSSLEITR